MYFEVIKYSNTCIVYIDGALWRHKYTQSRSISGQQIQKVYRLTLYHFEQLRENEYAEHQIAKNVQFLTDLINFDIKPEPCWESYMYCFLSKMNLTIFFTIYIWVTGHLCFFSICPSLWYMYHKMNSLCAMVINSKTFIPSMENRISPLQSAPRNV